LKFSWNTVCGKNGWIWSRKFSQAGAAQRSTGSATRFMPRQDYGQISIFKNVQGSEVMAQGTWTPAFIKFIFVAKESAPLKSSFLH
jgi:hypothetical protein